MTSLGPIYFPFYDGVGKINISFLWEGTTSLSSFFYGGVCVTGDHMWEIALIDLGANIDSYISTEHTKWSLTEEQGSFQDHVDIEMIQHV